MQQLSYKVNQVTNSGDTRLGSDPRLYVVMVCVKRLLRGIHVKMAPQSFQTSQSPNRHISSNLNTSTFSLILSRPLLSGPPPRSLSPSLFISLSISTSLSPYLVLSLFLSLSQSPFLSLAISLSASLSLSIYIYIYLRLSLISISICIYISISTSISIPIPISA